MSKLYTCTKCGKKKQAFEFYKRNTRPKGISSQCKLCISERDKLKYKDNKDIVVEKQKQYYQNHKEERSSYNKQYQEKNKEKLLEYYKEYDRTNKNKRTQYRKNHLVEDATRSAKRRAQRGNATPSWLTQTDISKIKSIYKMANNLTKKTGTPHHVDHIIPLKGEIVCGLHVPENLRVIAASENCSKGNKFINEDMV